MLNQIWILQIEGEDISDTFVSMEDALKFLKDEFAHVEWEEDSPNEGGGEGVLTFENGDPSGGGNSSQFGIFPVPLYTEGHVVLTVDEARLIRQTLIRLQYVAGDLAAEMRRADIGWRARQAEYDAKNAGECARAIESALTK